MKVWLVIGGVVLGLAILGAIVQPETEDPPSVGTSPPEERDPVVEACATALSGSGERFNALRDLSRLEPGLGIGPLARLSLRAVRNEQHEKAAEHLGRLSEACEQYQP